METARIPLNFTPENLTIAKFAAAAAKKKRRANHTLLMFANDNNNNPATGACLYFISCGNRQIVIFILASFSEQCTASLIENVKEKIFHPRVTTSHSVEISTWLPLRFGAEVASTKCI